MEKNLYDCIIVGGGIAGLQAAIQLGRYQRRACVIDHHQGRSNLCKSYKNVLGYPDGVSGQYLRDQGVKHASKLGVSFINAEVVNLEKKADVFEASYNSEQGEFKASAKTLILATGIGDNFPEVEELKPCLGLTIFICPDCDGYEIQNKPVAVIGTGKSGVSLANELLYWTKEITLYLQSGSLTEEELNTCIKQGIKIVDQPVRACLQKAGKLEGFLLADGSRVEEEHAFLAMGNNKVRTGLAEKVGVQLEENKHIKVNPRTKMTNIKGVWAAGDIGYHSEQLTIAMGEGTQAAIWVHKYLFNPNALDIM